MAIGTTIKTIQDIMRKDAGVDGDAQRISQLVWMIFLKIFDDREAEYELADDYRSPIPEPLRWRNWAAHDEGETGDALLAFVDQTLFPTLKTLPEGIRGATVVRAVFEDAYNYMKTGTLLRQVVNKINEIDFNNSKDRHLFGDLYEQILRDLQGAGNAGEYYTPRAVTQFMVDRVNPQLGEVVLDPACGTGGFLTCALEHMRSQVKTPKQELREGGRGAIVLPDGTLFGEGVKTRIKEKLLTECNLHTIVRLPNGVFAPYTGIKTNLLFFTKGKPTQEIWYYEHPYPAGYKSYSKTKPIRIEEFGLEQAWWDDRVESELAWRVPIKDIQANGYNLDIKNPHTVDVAHRDFGEMLGDYRSLEGDVAHTREQLRQVLMAALES
jgi:type I restriction-modification system DNA methylase subunit